MVAPSAYAPAVVGALDSASVGFLGSNTGFILLVVLCAILFAIGSRQRPTFSSIAAAIIGGLVLAGIVRLLWAIGSAPSIAVSFVKADFLQAIATIATAGATIALWVVTRRLMKVTGVQVYATTAPLISVIPYVQYDAPPEKELPTVPVAVTNAFPGYSFDATDQEVAEMSVWLREHDARVNAFDAREAQWRVRDRSFNDLKKRAMHDARMASTVAAHDPGPKPEPPFKRYIVVNVRNAQALSAYGFAMEISIDVSLTFPRYATVKGATPMTKAATDHSVTIPRTLAVPFLAGQGVQQLTAFRVDEIPSWQFTIAQVRFKDFRGKLSSFAVGSKITSMQAGNVTYDFGSFVPQKGELPL